MGIKSNLFLFKIKFILCEIACFLWYLTGIFAVLLFVGRRCFNGWLCVPCYAVCVYERALLLLVHLLFVV